MYPVLWTGRVLGCDLRITAYSTAFLLAGVAAFGLILFRASRERLPCRAVGFCALVAWLSALAGARLWHWLFHTSDWHSAAGLFKMNPSDFSLSGGLAVGGLAGVVSAALLRLPIRRLADLTAPALAAGIAVMRLGCFARGCCFGVETSLPWGVTFPLGSLAHMHQLTYRADVLFTGPVPVHPTQLYELLAAILAGVSAVILARTRLPQGTPFVFAAVTFLLLRCLAFSFRAGPLA